MLGPQRGIDDPAALNGSEEERLALFRRVPGKLRDYLREFAGQIKSWLRTSIIGQARLSPVSHLATGAASPLRMALRGRPSNSDKTKD
jgi:hypothetical protein